MYELGKVDGAVREQVLETLDIIIDVSLEIDRRQNMESIQKEYVGFSSPYKQLRTSQKFT